MLIGRAGALGIARKYKHSLKKLAEEKESERNQILYEYYGASKYSVCN